MTKDEFVKKLNDKNSQRWRDVKNFVNLVLEEKSQKLGPSDRSFNIAQIPHTIDQKMLIQELTDRGFRAEKKTDCQDFPGRGGSQWIEVSW